MLFQKVLNAYINHYLHIHISSLTENPFILIFTHVKLKRAYNLLETALFERSTDLRFSIIVSNRDFETMKIIFPPRDLIWLNSRTYLGTIWAEFSYQNRRMTVSTLLPATDWPIAGRCWYRGETSSRKLSCGCQLSDGKQSVSVHRGA